MRSPGINRDDVVEHVTQLENLVQQDAISPLDRRRLEIDGSLLKHRSYSVDLHALVARLPLKTHNRAGGY